MESPVHGSELIASDPDFHLIETFEYAPQTGVARLSMHLDRLTVSARYFGISFDPRAARAKVRALTHTTPLRCRMTLSVDGVLSLAAAPMPAPVSHWWFAVAEQRLAAGDPFLAHKTSRRAIYNDARNALPEGVDEWVFLNEQNELCEGTITNLAIQTPDGARLTPPLCSGCLPGVYRQSLLRDGKLREAALTLQDLREAKRVFFTNALRGEISASWSPDCKVLQDLKKWAG
ncbi:aminotransferase class IV family protein [Epibacterium ulvae]|uniref:aminotransferase class IV family protein n=1 Tax=Epibacterium ulvae TaxID=1156985 RepID=UPI001BFC4DAE|nr:aminotransferase class IV family protein [Epibacterium ulvae]MBT8154945.1 aminotransferase class IV family protein [Epibacterium ulvae]